MTPRPWHLDRRTLLRGMGVAVTLPFLEAMERGVLPGVLPGADPGGAPKRLVCVYFPNGCSLPDEGDAANEKWRWFPSGAGAEYRFTNVLAPLEPFREQISILGGLSHPLSRELLGHLAGDTWLTAGDLRGGSYKNRISMDQVAARALKRFTRYPSMVFSTDGGVGYKSRVSTLSFDANGRPIPSEHRQRSIFERYFAPDGDATSEERKKTLQAGKRVVDLVLEESKRLNARLGRHDRAKLEQFLDSVNSVEEQIGRNEQWIDIPLKPFDASRLELDPLPKVDPQAYVRATYDLMVLGLQTDVTRVMTHMLAREDGMGFGDSWPKIALGINRSHHTISHDTHEGHWDEWGPFDRWFAEQFAYFVGRLRETSDEHGPLLDNTAILYGSACSTTHNARNYPTALVGGKNLGLQHGRYTRYTEDVPFSNLLLTLLHAVGVPEERFGDSTGLIPGLLS